MKSKECAKTRPFAKRRNRPKQNLTLHFSTKPNQSNPALTNKFRASDIFASTLFDYTSSWNSQAPAPQIMKTNSQSKGKGHQQRRSQPTYWLISAFPKSSRSTSPLGITHFLKRPLKKYNPRTADDTAGFHAFSSYLKKFVESTRNTQPPKKNTAKNR